MEIRHKNSIKINSEEIELDDFIINEHQIVKLFLELQNDELTTAQLHDKIIYLLNLGCMADQSIKIGDKVDYVEKSFSALKQDMDNQIENNFSEAMKKKLELFLGADGSFVKEIQETFGADGKHSQKINELIESHRKQFESMLDRNNEDSPLRIIEKSFDEKFDRVMTFMASQEGSQKAEVKSTQKGNKFEDFVAPILSESAHFFNCNFERTSGVPGILGDKNSKKGDFVLTEKSNNKKIVLEAKKLTKDPTTKQILEYSRLAIENRAADYCVYIYCDMDDETVPEAGMFNEVAKNILFITISDTDTYQAKERMIRLGCSWALQRINADRSKDAELNEKLKKMEGILRKDLDRIKTMKNNSSSVVKACSDMITELEIGLDLKSEKTF